METVKKWISIVIEVLKKVLDVLGLIDAKKTNNT